MIITKNFFIFNPIWSFAKDLYVSRTVSGSKVWSPVKRAFVANSGQWKQVYAENLVGLNYQQHPYWQYTLDSEFRVNDNSSGNGGVATDLFNTFWSTANAGTYQINDGTARVNVNNLERTVIPGSAGFYTYTTETRNILCNFTNASAAVVTFSNPGVGPVNRTGVDGQTVQWRIQATGYTRSDSFVEAILTDNGTVQTFRMSRNAQATGTGITATLSRTYASSYTPPTSTQYRYYGLCRMLSNHELRVSTGQTYEISTSVVGGNVGSNTRWGIGLYTSPNAGEARPFGLGVNPQFSPTYGSNTTQQFYISVPNSHNYMRLELFVEYDSTSTTDSPPTLPRWARFDYLRVTRYPLG